MVAALAEKYKNVALMLEIDANNTPVIFMFSRSGMITNINPTKTMMNINISLIFSGYFFIKRLISNICMGNVKKIIAASDTDI